MDNRPAVLVDVDGVLNALFLDCDDPRTCDCHPGWTRLDAHSSKGRFELTLNYDHGTWLQDLADDHGAELVWASYWQDEANTWVSPTLGLPEDLPHVPIPPQFRDKFSVGEWKAKFVAAWAKGRPFVWFEDEYDVPAVLAERDDLGEYLVVEVDERTGLTAEHIAQAAAWLGRVSGTAA